jgi:hypothetical protein
MLHNNALPHAAQWMQYQLNTIWWEVHEYPAHSLVLSPCDFHIFGLLQTALEDCTFTWHGDVWEAVAQCLRQQSKKFLADGIYRIAHQWDSSQMPVVIFSYCCNTFICEHPKMGFSCTCLMYSVISFNTDEIKACFRTDLQDNIYLQFI